MRTLSLLVAAFVLTWAAPAYSQKKGAAKVPALDLKGKTVEKALADLISGMGEKDPVTRFAPQQQWQAVCVAAGAPGNEEKRLEVCKAMAANLGADVPEQARVWLLKQLEFLGRGESVAAIARAIDDPNDLVRESAVRGLANNPSDDAGAALVAKLSAPDAKVKIAVINALGFRRSTDVAAIGKELSNADATVVQAAARALGRIASPAAAEPLAKARGAAKEPARLWICDAYLLCADRMLNDGKTQEAAAIYNEIYNGEKLRAVRMAALKGVLKLAGDAAGERIAALLAGDDRDARDIALTEIPGISSKSLQVLAGSADKLPVQAQVLLIGALASRGEKSQMAIAHKATQSTDEAMQRAGYLALGRLGDASVVPSLVETSFSKSKFAASARDSLAMIVAPGVDEKLISLLKDEKQPGTRAGLIAILDARRAAGAVPVLIEEARGNDAALRAAAMKALAKLAEPKDVPALIPALLKTEAGRERDDAESAIAIVVGRIVETDDRAAPIIAAITPETKSALLPLIGRVGGAKARAVAKEALSSDAKDVKKAAVIALCNWPDESVSADLLVLAKDGPDAEFKKLAFAGVVRVNSLANDRPAPPRLASLKQAMELAAADADKKLVIDALATVKDIETLRFVVPYLDQKELVQPACKTLVELAHSKTLREPNQAEFNTVLDRTITLCRDKGLIERAKKYRAGN